MRTSAAAALAIAFGAANVAASPVTKRQNTTASTVDDTTILNYARESTLRFASVVYWPLLIVSNLAVTLEHLENAFYRDALAQFDAAAFESAGFPAWVRGRFAQIAEHEASHVAVLSGALGDAAVQPCEYTFPYTDPKSFGALSAVIENVGVSGKFASLSLSSSRPLTLFLCHFASLPRCCRLDHGQDLLDRRRFHLDHRSPSSGLGFVGCQPGRALVRALRYPCRLLPRLLGCCPVHQERLVPR
jgi:hypothetical protein